MTMYDDDHKSKQITVECKNCGRFITFMVIPQAEPMVVDFYCNLKCIDEYKNRQRTKEQITEKTLED